MQFKIDENLPAEAASTFRSAGYDAVSVIEQQVTPRRGMTTFFHGLAAKGDARVELEVKRRCRDRLE